MRIAGWIFLGIGVISFLGAALKGHSVLGPVFWIGLGFYLLKRANSKASDDDDKPVAQ